MTHNLSDLGGVDLPRPNRCGGGCRGRMSCGSVPDQIDPGLRHTGEVSWFPMTHNVHVKEARALVEEMIMERSDLQSVVEKRGHDRVYLVFGQHEVAHHNILTAVAFRHRQPASESE